MLTQTFMSQESSGPRRCRTNGNHLKGAPHTNSNSQEASDEDLIKSLADGDKRALQLLFVRHKVRVFRFALRFVRNEAVAEEVVSEVFFEVWRHAGEFEYRSRVSTWLLAIARHKAIAAVRYRPHVRLDEDLATTIEDPSDDPEVANERRDRSATLRKCLAQLSSAHREIIDLVYYHEKSVGEVAQILGVPESTVKTRMFYARNRIATFLEKAGVDRASL
jgi:RNA polymerase sigma-70 factor (ECF subfamily)